MFYPTPFFNLCKRFSSMYTDDFWRPILLRLLHVYIVCNTLTTLPAEVAVVAVQTSLETMANAFLLESTPQILSKSSFDKMSAAQRMNELLTQLAIPAGIPDSLPNLEKTASMLSLCTGPEILVKLRNVIIHPTRGNRMVFGHFSAYSRIEAWRLAMWYYDLSLLSLFGYRGAYVSRLLPGYEHERTEKVPWA